MGRCYPRKTLIPDPRKPHERLSFMQFALAQRLCQGKTESKCGAELSIHRTAVQKHKRRLLINMGIASLADLKQYAKANGVFKCE